MFRSTRYDKVANFYFVDIDPTPTEISHIVPCVLFQLILKSVNIGHCHLLNFFNIGLSPFLHVSHIFLQSLLIRSHLVINPHKKITISSFLCENIRINVINYQRKNKSQLINFKITLYFRQPYHFLPELSLVHEYLKRARTPQ
jgi:hypothetical protein